MQYVSYSKLGRDMEDHSGVSPTLYPSEKERGGRTKKKYRNLLHSQFAKQLPTTKFRDHQARITAVTMRTGDGITVKKKERKKQLDTAACLILPQ